MASTIAAVTTSGGGVVTTADASGNLNLLAGTTTVVALTTAGAAVTGTLSATGTLSGGTSGTGYSFSGSAPATSLTLDSSGNLLVGTTSSSLSGQGINGIVVSRSGAVLLGLNNSNNTNQAWTHLIYDSGLGAAGTYSIGQIVNGSTGGVAGGPFTPILNMAVPSAASNTAKVTIDSSGDVIIGGTTATATARLNVYQADSSLRVVHFENTRNISGDENLRLVLGTNCNNTSSYQLIASTGGADKLYILGNGNVQNTNNSYGALSDIKLKENIADATPKLADLMQVRVRNYNLIGDSTKQIGVVAQELETIFPAMVDESPDRDGEGGNLGTVTKSVKYSVFVPMLIKAMQEQQSIITALTDRIAALEAK